MSKEDIELCKEALRQQLRLLTERSKECVDAIDCARYSDSISHLIHELKEFE